MNPDKKDKFRKKQKIYFQQQRKKISVNRNRRDV